MHGKHRNQLEHLIEKRVRVGFCLSLALLAIIGLVSYQTTLKLRDTDAWEAHIEELLAKLDLIALKLRDAEISQRSYIITGNARDLAPYQASLRVIDSELQELHGLTSDVPNITQQINILDAEVALEWQVNARANTLRLREGPDVATQIALAEQSKQLAQRILNKIDQLEEEQNQLLQKHTDQAEARALVLNLTIGFGSFLAIVLVTFMLIRDIVERRQINAALRESAARFDRLAENALDVIYRYRVLPTPGFEYVSMAAATLTGYTPEEFYADPGLGFKLVHPDDSQLIEVLKHPARNTGSLTMRWIHKSGAVVWTSHQLVPVYNDDGTLVALEGIVRDISERMQAYQMLEQRVEERTREIDRRRRVAESLRDIVTILNSNHALDETLDAIIGSAVQLLGTSAGAIYRLTPEEDLLGIQVARGLVNADLALSIPLGADAVGAVVLGRQPVWVRDTRTARHGTGWPELDTRLDDLYERYRALLAVPLLVRDEVYGAIALYYDQPHDFSGEEVEIAMAFSDQGALAIANARLRIQAEQTAVAAERSRLARDLHDAVTQTLFSTSLIADVLPRIWERNADEGLRRLEELRQLTRGALAEMRTLLLELRPASLIEIGLGDLLGQLTAAITGRTRIPVTLAVEGQCQLPPDVQVALYRIAQEALNNVARHANAQHVAVQLRCLPEQIELTIDDDGHGFEPAQIDQKHFGLRIMRERAETIGAQLWIDTQIGQGTQIVLIWSPARGMAGEPIALEVHAPAAALALSRG